MDVGRFKKKANSKEAWLEWLADEPPSAATQSELRQRFVQQANNYQPRQYTPPASQINPTLARPQTLQSPQPARPVAQPLQTQMPPPATTAPSAPSMVAPAPQSAANGVSIHITIPQLRIDRLRRVWGAGQSRFLRLRGWFAEQWVTRKRRTLVVSCLAVLAVAGILAPPLLHFGAKHSTSSAAGASASTATYKKPPFKVVVPSTKPRLATPDGVHAAYDGAKNSYSYSDSIGGNGFIVSEQPIPDRFNTATEAVNKLGPQIYGSTGHTVSTTYGDAYVAVSGKNTAQTVVFSVHNLLMFLQSSHKFSDTDVEDYINLMQ